MNIFTLPDLGEGLTEAELVTWLVAVGEEVAVDQPVAEVETAKATVEVPSPFAGTVAVLHGEPGTSIPVGAPLISIGAVPDGAVPDLDGERYRQEERAGSGNVLIGYGTGTPGSGRTRRRRGRPPTAAPARIRVASPPVRKLARDRGLDLATLTGTGPDGLITRADVEAAPTDPPAASSGAEQAGRPVGPDPRPVRTVVPLRGLRGAVAETLARSRREIPEATTWVDVDATALVALRSRWRDAGDDTAPGLLALISRFALAGLDRHPELNARVHPGEVRHLDGVNLGVAVQAERGLVVPVVRDAHRLSARALHREIGRLGDVARDGSATAADLTGGTFTINNYGVFGVDGSAAIIHHPEVAILGIGRLLDRPWVVDGAVVPRTITQLSLVFDHRVCDGGTAAGFLRFVADAIENPAGALADL